MNVNITRILLIEDNAGDVRLLQEMLKEAGDRHYDLTCTDRLSTGLKYLSEQHPDIILMDMGLPDSQGLGTLDAVLSATKGIPVVILTGMNDESVGVQAIRQGAQDYLIKGSLDSRAIARVIDYSIERKHTEIALKASEERFRRLAENIPDIVSLFNFVPSRGYEYVSSASKVVTGYKPEEYYANPELGSETIYPADRELQQSMANKPELFKNTPLITRYIRKDGRIVWVERRQMPIYNDAGKLIALEGIERDVTEDIRMEEALQMSEKNFRNSIDSSPMGIRIVTANGETIYANNAMLRIYGYKNMEELRAKSIKERYTTESYHEFLERKEKRERGEYVSSNYEINIMRKDGVMRHLEVFREEVLWGGKPQFQMLYRDITEQKLAETALKASEENFRNSLDNSLIGIRVSDINSHTLYANQAMLDIFGYKNIDEVRTKTPPEYYTPDCYAEYLKMSVALKRGEKMQDSADIDIVRKDGTIRHLQALFKVIRWDGKNQYQTLYHDITDRKQTEEIIRQMEVMKQVDLLRSELLANVSHELRTPYPQSKGLPLPCSVKT